MVEHYGIVVERMCRKVYAYELALLLEQLHCAPRFATWHWRSGYLYATHVAEQRVLHRRLLGLIHLAVAQYGFYKGIALDVLREVLLALDAERVESTAQRKRFKCLAVD